MYSHVSSISISSLLFVFMLIGFVSQTIGMYASRYEFFLFEDIGIEMLIAEIFSLFYSFAFVLWQTQITYFLRNSDDIYRLIVGLCIALALIWCCALISSLVAYTYNALLLFLLLANTLQSLLIPYALFQLKSQHEQYPRQDDIALPKQSQQASSQPQEKTRLLEELGTVRRKLEEQNEVQRPRSTTIPVESSLELDIEQPTRITRVSFADQPYVAPHHYYR